MNDNDTTILQTSIEVNVSNYRPPFDPLVFEHVYLFIMYVVCELSSTFTCFRSQYNGWCSIET